MKSLLFFPLLFGCLLSIAQTSPAMQKAAEKVCDCMNELKYDDTRPKEFKDAAMNCIITAGMSEIVDIAEERNVEITDEKAMEEIGLELGKVLFKNGCKGYIELSKIMAFESEEASVKSISGKVVRIDTKDFIYIVLKDKTGREQSFIWLEYFPGSENLTGNKINSLVGKDVKLAWLEKEAYIPKAGDYFPLKQIVSLAF